MNNEINETSLKENEVLILNKAYKGADMGSKALEKLLSISQNDEFSAVIKRHLNGYMEIKSKLSKKIYDSGNVPKSINAMESSMLKMSIMAKTAMDKSIKKMSEMAFQGTNMGILEMCQINNSANISEENAAFMSEILKEYEEFATELRAFL